MRVSFRREVLYAVFFPVLRTEGSLSHCRIFFCYGSIFLLLLQASASSKQTMKTEWNKEQGVNASFFLFFYSFSTHTHTGSGSIDVIYFFTRTHTHCYFATFCFSTRFRSYSSLSWCVMVFSMRPPLDSILLIRWILSILF